MPLNRNQDFMFEDTTQLTTNAQSLKGALNEVNASLASIVMNVKSKGAKGDGVTDDSASIQSAINSIKTTGGILFFPAGTYLINSPLNFTNMTNAGVIVRGAGRSSNSGIGTRFIANTGGILFDGTGAGQLSFEHFTVVSGTSNPSTVAFMLARSVANPYGEFNNIDDVYINLATNPTANSNNGNVGIYNYGSELGRYRNIYVVADNPVIFAVANILNIPSTFTSVNTSSISMTECTIDGASTLIGLLNSACWLSNVSNIKLDNIYVYNSGSTTSTYAFNINGINTNIEITGHLEGYHQTANITNQNYGLILEVSRVYYSNDDQIVLSQGSSGISAGRIKVIPNAHPNGYTNNVIKESVSSNGVKNCFITLDSGQTLGLNSGYVTANIVLANDNSPNIKTDRVSHYFGTSVPSTGTYNAGDTLTITNPSIGTATEYTCVLSGTPGLWRVSKQTVRQSNTASRPTGLTASDTGLLYMDTTLSANGKPIQWNGAVWVDSTGSTV